MVGVAARMLSGVAMLALSEGARVGKRPGRDAPEFGTPRMTKSAYGEMDVIQMGDCSLPNFLFQIVRQKVMVAWSELEEHDPVVFRTAGEHSFNVIGCNVALDADANISLAGFSDGGLKQLSCDAMQTSAGGTVYSFTGRLSFGDCKDELEVAGGVDADWGLCGRDIPRHQIDASFRLIGPGLEVKLSVELPSGGASAQIIDVKAFALSFGVPDNYKCGFEGLPGFVGGLLGDWCVSLMDWVAARIQTHLQGDVQKWVGKLLGQRLETPAAALAANEVSVSSNGCKSQSDQDQIARKRSSLSDDVRNVVIGCIGQSQSCVTRGVANMGFSSSCSACVGTMGTCAKDNCKWTCTWNGFKSEACKTCTVDYCFDALVGCSGLPRSQLPDP